MHIIANVVHNYARLLYVEMENVETISILNITHNRRVKTCDT